MLLGVAVAQVRKPSAEESSAPLPTYGKSVKVPSNGCEIFEACSATPVALQRQSIASLPLPNSTTNHILHVFFTKLNCYTELVDMNKSEIHPLNLGNRLPSKEWKLLLP